MTVMRGLILAKGSWNTIWLCERKVRKSRLDNAVMSCPLTIIWPLTRAWLLSNWLSARAIVVLPEPDSPTIPNACPFRRVISTSFTASNQRLVPPNKLFSIGNCTFRLLTCNTVGNWLSSSNKLSACPKSCWISERVYSAFGSLNTAAVCPCSIVCPWRITMTSSL